MRVIRGIHNLRAAERGCVLTIGNFDGVHRGHLAVIDALKGEAQRRSLSSVVMTFEPTPQEYFAGAAAPARLSSVRGKIEVLAAAGVDRVLLVRFNARVAALSAELFIQRYLVDGLGAHAVLVGDDFRFGRNRGGDVGVLRRAGRRYGFSVRELNTFTLRDERISSTSVRAALARGAVAEANAYLGRPYRLTGRVIRGRQLGRQLGFPTANIRLCRRPAPMYGVYAALASVCGQAPRPALLSLGTRPTVAGSGCLLEVYFLDFDQDIYGRRLDVEFLHFLRPEQRFDTAQALTAQMRLDENAARDYFSTRAANGDAAEL